MLLDCAGNRVAVNGAEPKGEVKGAGRVSC